MGLLTSTDKQKLQNKDQWIFIQLVFAVKSYVLANQENKQTNKNQSTCPSASEDS